MINGELISYHFTFLLSDQEPVAFPIVLFTQAMLINNSRNEIDFLHLRMRFSGSLLSFYFYFFCFFRFI